jgi:hypothetical protein
MKICVLMCFYTSVKDDLSNANYTASNDWLKLNNELERMLKAAVIAKFKELRRYLSESTE